MVRRGSSTMVGLSAPRVLVVPRWGGTATDDWYAWLQSELPGTTVLDLPQPDAPSLQAWTDAIVAAIGTDPYALARTLVVGHSVGCLAVLHALAKLPPGRAVNKVLCVAGWWTVDTPWPELGPWMEAPLELESVQEGHTGIRVLVSTNDPYTADYEANAALWRERLEADVVIVPEAKHFNGQVQPIVLDQARTLYVEL